MKEPVQGCALESRATLFDVEQPGVFFVDASMLSMFFECPCGCGGHSVIRIHRSGTPKPENKRDGSGPSWEWNGSTTSPTLQPSIRDMGGCFFHGHLTNGLWTFEDDSGVKQA
jgi:hypothetical protein